MAKKYLTPDFDVTVYEIGDTLTLDEILSGDPDNAEDGDYSGDLGFGD